MSGSIKGEKLKIVLVGQTPPPVHGQAMMLEQIVAAPYKKLEIIHVRMSFSQEIGSVGRFDWRKVFHLCAVAWRTLKVRMQSGASILFYPPAGPNLIPVLRDVVLLSFFRLIFRKTIFNFRAAGLGEFVQKVSKPWRWLLLAVYGKADLAIVLSHRVKGDAEYLHARSIGVVPNGIPDRCPGGVARRSFSRTPRLLYLGTISEAKGVEDLLQACAELDSQGFEYVLTLAGGISDQTSERKYDDIAKMLAGNVKFLGEVSGEVKWRAFREADIFCFPSKFTSESFPGVLLEAMMFSLPIISTHWRSIPEIVVEGETGLLVQPGNVSELAKGIVQLLRDEPEAVRMGQAGRKRYESSFTYGQFVESMERAILSVAQPQPL